MQIKPSQTGNDPIIGSSQTENDGVFVAPTADPVFYRTYSRIKPDNTRETFLDNIGRTQTGLAVLGKLTPDEAALLRRMHTELKVLPSGRWMWCGGTEWVEQQKNFFGVYNCSSTKIDELYDLVRLMNLSMTGCGVGWVIENVHSLPSVKRKINLKTVGEFGTNPSIDYSASKGFMLSNTHQLDDCLGIIVDDGYATLYVGDSREAWCQAYYFVLRLFSDDYEESDPINLTIDFSHVRKPDTLIKGFGGKANPKDLVKFFEEIISFLNERTDKYLTPTDVAWLACRSLATVVAGNIRRSAGMSQGAYDDERFASAKSNMWTQDSEGNWKIDPAKDALRMANFTRVYHHKPSLEEITQAVTTQYHSSEGAIQYAPEAIARGNIDILDEPKLKRDFLEAYTDNKKYGLGFLTEAYYQKYGEYPSNEELEHRLNRYGLNPLTLAA